MSKTKQKKTQAQTERELEWLQDDVATLFNSILERMTVEELSAFRDSLGVLIHEKSQRYVTRGSR